MDSLMSPSSLNDLLTEPPSTEPFPPQETSTSNPALMRSLSPACSITVPPTEWFPIPTKERTHVIMDTDSGEGTTTSQPEQDDALRRLDLITSEAGWYVYCFIEEEWHLYNDDEELLFTAATPLDLVNCFEPRPVIPTIDLVRTPQEYKVTKMADESPVSVDPQLYSTYEDKTRNRHA